MLQGTYEYMGLLSLWVPPPDTDELAEQAVRFWTRVTPDIPFMGFATGRFIEVATKLGIPLEDAGLTGLRAPPGFGLGRGGMPLMTAGAECYAYVGGPCGQSPGAHIHEDWAVVQAVDPATGKEVPDGEWGNLTVTTLDRDNGLLRYDLEEACAILREPCPCGETSIRGLWGGRFADLLSCQGTRFQLSELEASLRSEELVAQPSLEYQVVRPDDGPAPLEVRVEVATEDGELRGQVAARVAAEIKEKLGVVAAVEALPRDTLPRAGYKAKRVVDRRLIGGRPGGRSAGSAGQRMAAMTSPTEGGQRLGRGEIGEPGVDPLDAFGRQRLQAGHDLGPAAHQVAPLAHPPESAGGQRDHLVAPALVGDQGDQHLHRDPGRPDAGPGRGPSVQVVDGHVPPVGVAGHQGHGLRPGAPDQDRDPVQWHRQLPSTRRPEERTLVVHRLARPEPGEQLQGLVQAAATIGGAPRPRNRRPPARPASSRSRSPARSGRRRDGRGSPPGGPTPPDGGRRRTAPGGRGAADR